MAGKRNHYLIKDIFKRNFIIIVISLLTAMICVVVDSVLTGQFLGQAAVASVGLITPATSILMALTNLFASGVGQLCTRSMGKADLKQVNRIFSTLMTCSFCLCAVTSVLLFAFAPSIARILGPTAAPEVLSAAGAYLRGYAFNLVPAALAFNLIPLMALDNDQKRCMVYAFVVSFADIALDLANVLFFHGGMLGMALATSASSMLGLLVMLLHFRKDGHLLHYSAKHPDFGCLKEAVLIGMGQTISQISQTVRAFFVNNLLLMISGSAALAAYSVAGSAFVLVFSVITALMSATSTVTSLSYGEEDRNALKRTLRASLRSGFKVGLVFTVLFLVFALPVSHAFLRSGNTDTVAQAARFVRCYAVQLLFTLGSYTLCGSFVGTQHVRLSYLLCVLRDAVFPVVCMASGGFLLGIRGVELGLVFSGVLTLAACFLIPWITNQRFPASAEGFLILPAQFQASPEELFEASMHTTEDVSETSERIRQFCLTRGESEKTAMFVSLFVEEMAGNAVQHGFQGRGGHVVELRLILREGKRLIRLRDNGIPFDPVKWLEANVPEGPEESLGIRMIVGLAKNVDYIPSMGMNQVIVRL